LTLRAAINLLVNQTLLSSQGDQKGGEVGAMFFNRLGTDTEKVCDLLIVVTFGNHNTEYFFRGSTPIRFTTKPCSENPVLDTHRKIHDSGLKYKVLTLFAPKNSALIWWCVQENESSLSCGGPDPWQARIASHSP